METYFTQQWITLNRNDAFAFTLNARHTHQLFAEIARHDFAALSGSSPSQMFISLSRRLIIIVSFWFA